MGVRSLFFNVLYTSQYVVTSQFADFDDHQGLSQPSNFESLVLLASKPLKPLASYIRRNTLLLCLRRHSRGPEGCSLPIESQCLVLLVSKPLKPLASYIRRNTLLLLNLPTSMTTKVNLSRQISRA